VQRCLGAHVLRVGSKIVLEEFLTRIPEFELDRTRQPKWTSGQLVRMESVSIIFERLGAESRNAGVRTWLGHATM
jgi:hypothetical protein